MTDPLSPLLPSLYAEATEVYKALPPEAEDAREWFKIRVAVASKIDQMGKAKRPTKGSGNRLQDDGGPLDDDFPDIL